MPSFNMFSVLKPLMKETYAEKKLKQPKIAKPSTKAKKPKPIIPGQGGY